MVNQHDPMPVFVIKAKDALAPDAVRAYLALCRRHNLTRQAHEVAAARDEIEAWQQRNPDLLKLPDHKHIPAASQPRVWALPEQPPDVCTVRGKESGMVYHLDDNGDWHAEDDDPVGLGESWADVLLTEGKIEEVLPGE